jgi:hypothetical protein
MGSSIRLKQKFGAGYQVSISVLPPGGSQVSLTDLAVKADVVKEAFRQVMQLEPFDESKAYIQVRSHDGVCLPILWQQGTIIGIRESWHILSCHSGLLVCNAG